MKRLFVVLVLLVACAKSERRAVIFVGLDGADWRILDRFAADGTMPVVAELMRSGDRRVLLTQHPPLSPIVWTTMMTGVSPLEHRILDFTRFDPVTREQQPITSDERAVPAIWNMATARGKKVGVFGLWATDPPEAGVVLPKPNLPIDEETAVTRRTALDWITGEKPDLAIVYFQGTDEIAHIVSGDMEKARPFYARIDKIVGEFRALAESQHADLIIASDHGFDWGGKHEESSTATATAGKWHRDEGIFLYSSPAEAGATSSRPANIQQVCATLLALLGLPHDDRLAPPIDGVVARSQQILDYRRLFRRSQRRASESKRDQEAIARLKALGYIGSGDASRAPSNATTTRTPASFNNEGLILGEQGKLDEAERAFLGALAIDPQYAPARTNLSELLIARARRKGGAGAIEDLTRALALRDSDDAYLMRGRYRLEGSDCRGALADFAAIKKPTALSWASMAAAHGCLGDEMRARDAARKSLQLDPNQPQLRALLRGDS